MAVAGSVRATGSHRSLLGEPLPRRKSVRNPRQARHHPAEGHPACETIKSRMGSARLIWPEREG